MSAETVAVIGSGGWGTALADALRRNGSRVIVWSRDEVLARTLHEEGRNERYLPGIALAPGIEATTDLAAALQEASVVVCVVPSHVVREVMERAAAHLDRPLLVSATKGIEIATGLRMSEVLSQTLGPAIETRIAVLSGPSFADELARRLPTAVVAASADPDAARRTQGLFQNDYFRVYTQSDVVGTELGGALKNVIALAAGMSDGLKLGSNARAALITRGLAEMVRLAVRQGAHEATLAGLAGIGDLVLTCTGDLSRNRRAGLAIGSGGPPAEVLERLGSVVEGFRTARAARELAARYEVEMPIVNAVYSILYEDLPPPLALAALMAREPKPERWS